MKKILFMAAAMAAVLSSCSKNEVSTSTLDSQALDFNVYTGVSTKGTEVTTTTLGASSDAGFGVFGYYSTTDWANTDEPNFMFNQNVKGNGTGEAAASAWSYSPMKYWPNNTKDVLSFYAYAPFTKNATPVTFDAAGTMAGVPELTFSINAAAASMVDFVVATPIYNQTNTTDYNQSQADVSFNFKHALTRASFSAYLDVTDFPVVGTGNNGTESLTENTTSSINGDHTKVYVTKMGIVSGTDGTSGTASAYVDKTGTTTSLVSTGFHSSATFTYLEPDGTDKTTTTSTDGDVLGVGDWSAPTANSGDYDFSALLNTTTNAFTTNITNNAGTGVDCTYTPAGGVDVTSVSSTAPTTLFKTTTPEYLFLIPADGANGIGTNNNVYVYVEYDVVTLDPNLEAKYSVVTNKDIIKLSNATLKANTAYNFILTIGLDEVTVTATVAAWDTAIGSSEVTPNDN